MTTPGRKWTPEEIRREVYDKSDKRCHNCRKHLTRSSATIDHRTPIKAGGSQMNIKNLRIACLTCNSRDGALYGHRKNRHKLSTEK